MKSSKKIKVGLAFVVAVTASYWIVKRTVAQRSQPQVLAPTLGPVTSARPAARHAAVAGQAAKASERNEFYGEFHPRPASEWQGMLVDLSVEPTCEGTDKCSLAQVCKAGRCAPCERDEECLSSEACVLDHCVRRENVECRRAADCQGVPCVLSGYSQGPRNNQEMRSYCGQIDSGFSQPEQVTPVVEDHRPPPESHRLIERVQATFEKK